MRALVFANGEPPSQSTIDDCAALARLVVAADGGAAGALEAGVTPGAVVGDLDSLPKATRIRFTAAQLHQDNDPERTDLQQAIDFCIEAGADRIDVLAAGGGRADHALANLSVVALYRGVADVRLIDDWFEIRLVDGMARIDRDEGTIVSLVAIGPCTGVTTRGMRWDLTDASLGFSPRGIHNEVATRPAVVRVLTGDLLLFEGRRVERHA